jgi:aspartate kinase
MLIVQKFGGTSLANRERVLRAAKRAAAAAKAGHRVVVVVSAQGDTTDQLLEKARALNGAGSSRELDACMAAGEQLSAGLMALALEALGQEAVSLTGWQAGIYTDDTHSDAKILGLRGDRIRKELDRGNVVVVAGFQGINSRGDITTLGRGGSDTTAVALAAFLNADKCQIYTDVDGVYDRDPRGNPDAVRFDTIGYDKMLSMARNGARVLHDRCVELARDHGILLEVLSSFEDRPGTLVGPLP